MTMSTLKKAGSALISVFHKEGLEPVVKKLDALGVQIYSTGGTEKYIRDLGIPVTPVEEVTSYPSILGGRVKTLHPKVFGGILNRQDNEGDVAQLETYDIPQLDIVIVDLYPFEMTVAAGGTEEEIIEKIDIGGISLIRAAAKNYKDVWVVPSRESYREFLDLLEEHNGGSTEEIRQRFATLAFQVSSGYDTAIHQYFYRGSDVPGLTISEPAGVELRYGENPHQKGYYYGDLNALFNKLHGKALSYNNLLDIDAAVNLMAEFADDDPTFAILKHNNACGLATRDTVHQAYVDALAGDPVSAFGGILITNTEIDEPTATAIHELFCEVVIAPSFTGEALKILKGKKNRIILVQKPGKLSKKLVRTALNGFLVQDKDYKTDSVDQLQYVTDRKPDERELRDLIFASKICKHTKSNTIVLARDRQLCASGTGQTSRVDALRQAINKAKSFNFQLEGAVMASDAFFPFPDCVEIASEEKIGAVIQPGGSIKDQLSIDFCNGAGMAMVMTGTRHFKH